MGPLSGQNSEQYKRFGLEPPKGILFYGVPGTGKTRLAQALANEMSEVIKKPVNFIYRKGIDVASKWFGESSENLRRVFEEAKVSKPAILFFDELDGLCPSRDKPYLSEAYVTIVTTMLGLIDELPKGEIFIIGATNRMDDIDPALRRPGRFDKYLEFLPPAQQGRQEILKIHTDDWKVKPSLDLLTQLSHQTTGFSGADLAKLCLDAFDNALSREILAEREKKHVFTYQNVDLDNLNVTEHDWQFALAKMKSSTAGVFGSAHYIPENTFTSEMQPLLQETLNTVKQLILTSHPEQIKITNGGQSNFIVQALYIWSKHESILSSLEDHIIAPVLGIHGGDQMSNFAKYILSPTTLQCIHTHEWPKKVDSIFSQAIGSHIPSILFMPDIDDLCHIIKSHQMSESVGLKRQLERLRETQVLLLATGSCPSVEFSYATDNPFNGIPLGVKEMEIQPPTAAQCEAFFNGLLVANEVSQNVELTVMTQLCQVLSKLTQNQELGSILALYDQVKHALACASSEDEIQNFIKDVISGYEMNRALINMSLAVDETAAAGNNEP